MAKTTAMLEDAAQTAVAGQSERLSAGDYARTARWLQADAQDIVILAEATAIAANLARNGTKNRRKSGR